VIRSNRDHDARFPGCCASALQALLAFLALATVADAQQRPLATEDPDPIGAGRWVVEVGGDWTADRSYPASGLTGDLLRLPVVGVRVGLGAVGELQVDGGFYNRLAITDREDAPLTSDLDFTGDATCDVEDLVVATKVRVSAESPRWPALGVRFATRLPNANSGSGLGLDTMDFLATLLAARSVQAFRVAANAGLGILGDPMHPGSQNDVVLAAASVARPLTARMEFVSEIEGRIHIRHKDATPGTGSRGAVRVGGRYLVGAARFDLAVIAGLTSSDGDWGITAGYSRVF
jgi:hypothetical protein